MQSIPDLRIRTPPVHTFLRKINVRVRIFLLIGRWLYSSFCLDSFKGDISSKIFISRSNLDTLYNINAMHLGGTNISYATEDGFLSKNPKSNSCI